MMNIYISLQKEKLDVLYVTNPINVSYLTGFRGVSGTEREGTVVVKDQTIHLILPKLYEQEGKVCAAKSGIKLWILEERGRFANVLEEIMTDANRIGFEAGHIEYSEYESLKKKFPEKLVPMDSVVEDLRMIKTKKELKSVRLAADYTDKVFEKIEMIEKIGMTERELAKVIMDCIYDFGCGLSFDPIVAFGENSALPHYVPGDIKIGKGILLIDLGAKYKGYCGDLTRTYYLGEQTDKYKEVYDLVLTANQKVIESIKPGVTEKELWQVCVGVLGERIEYMPHTLGHGVGLDVHENPRLYKDGNRKLEPGMVVTVEPGLYYPGWGGIRIEDYVLITEDGCEVLSNTNE